MVIIINFRSLSVISPSSMVS